jgi:hypothetical protein
MKNLIPLCSVISFDEHTHFTLLREGRRSLSLLIDDEDEEC